ncbi:MAG: hypothetical protein HYX55_06685 [Chloroflexi bacterium]|nr:hypothetical protein [Chloroflexota bacterium]
MGQASRPAWLTVGAPRLAIAGVVMPLWFLGFSTILALTRTGYDLVWDPISRLGANGAADPLIWQVGGFLAAAVHEVLDRSGGVVFGEGDAVNGGCELGDSGIWQVDRN